MVAGFALCLRETPARAHTIGMRHIRAIQGSYAVGCACGVDVWWWWGSGPAGSRTPVFRNRRVCVCVWVGWGGGSSLVGVGAPRARLASVPWTNAIRCRPGSVLSIPGLGRLMYIYYLSVSSYSAPFIRWVAYRFISLFFNTVISNKNNGKSGYNMLISPYSTPNISVRGWTRAGQEKFPDHQAS